MRPDFWFGVAIVLGGLAVMAYGAWPKKPDPPEFKTLAIWTAENGVGMLQWWDGVMDRKQLESIPPAQQGFRLSEIITVKGRPVSAEWAKSMLPTPHP